MTFKAIKKCYNLDKNNYNKKKAIIYLLLND